jgi:hypothetical protein
VRRVLDCSLPAKVDISFKAAELLAAVVTTACTDVNNRPCKKSNHGVVPHHHDSFLTFVFLSPLERVAAKQNQIDRGELALL